MRCLPWLCLTAMLAGTIKDGPAQAADPDRAGSNDYVVVRLADADVQLDGRLAEPFWREAKWLEGLTFPWEQDRKESTRFGAFVTRDKLCFAFQVRDAHLVLSDKPPENEMGVTEGDRVELFFARDPQLKDYYCLEIDPRGRVLDYRARYRRRFDADWDCAGLRVYGRQSDGGYVVEGTIDRRTFEELELPDLWSGGMWTVGIFRAEFTPAEPDPPQRSWASWIRPDSTRPDFHLPSAFGRWRSSAAPARR